MTAPTPCYFLTPKGAEVHREMETARTYDDRETAERMADHLTPDGEAWRDYFELYEVRPVQ